MQIRARLRWIPVAALALWSSAAGWSPSPAQDPAPAPGQGAEQDVGVSLGRPVEDPRLWALLDEVVAVVGDEVITLRDLQGQFSDRTVQARRQEFAKLPPAEREQAETNLQTEILAELVERLLRTRAGEDRGFDPGLVQRLVDDRIQNVMSRQGGSKQYRDWLDSVGFDPEGFRQWTERNLYQQAWEGSVRGIQPGPTGRLDRDTFVRPGQLYSAYLRLANSPRLSERAVVGYLEGEVELAEMALSFQANGGEEATAKLVSELRRRILAGEEEFDTLAAEFGQGGQAKHITTNLEAVRTASNNTFGNEGLFTFAENASPGEVSPALLSLRGGLNLYQLVSRTPGSAVQPFASLDTQDRVRKWVDSQRDLVRLGRGTEDLLRRVSIQPEALARFMARPAWLYRESNGGR